MKMYLTVKNALRSALVALCLLPSVIWAALDLELTQGMNGAVPIAIAPFNNESVASVPGDTTLSALVTHDLQNSGQFAVATVGMMDQSHAQLPTIDFDYWRKKGLSNLLLAQVTALGGDRYQVHAELYSTFDQSTLMDATFTAGQSGLRALAHRISDAVYQKVTGIPGVFSTKIAYVLVQNDFRNPPRYTLEIADEDGFAPHPLLSSSQPIMSPSWAPDGYQIAYVSFEGGQPGVYVQDIRTGSRRLLSQFSGINGAPSFSPDGTRVAMVLTRTGNPKIYILNLGARTLMQITDGYSIDTEPRWTPDARAILFTSDRGGTPQIYRYTLANKQVDRLTFDGNYNARASIAADQQGIVVMHRDSGGFGIGYQDLSSGRLQVLTQTGSDESPSLAPNGKMVLYATRYGGRGVLAMVSTDGRIKLRLPAPEGSVQEPAWSPFLH